MDDVAREAGVGVGTVYRHFPHKDALMGELVAQKFRAFGDNAERALEVEDPWEALRGAAPRQRGDVRRATCGIQEALARTPEAWRLADAEFQRLDALANQLVARAQAAGVLRPDFAVDDIPMLMCGLDSTMAVPGYDWHRHLEIILDGLRARGRTSVFPPLQGPEPTFGAMLLGLDRPEFRTLVPCRRPCRRVQNSSERVFADLLEALLAGRYAPGEKLPTPARAGRRPRRTMQPLREALKRLEQMGVVEVRHGDAMRVRDWRAHGRLDVLPTLGPARARRPARGALAHAARDGRPGRRAPRRRARADDRRAGRALRRRAQASDPRDAAERRLRLLHRGRRGRRQPRLPADPQRASAASTSTTSTSCRWPPTSPALAPALRRARAARSPAGDGQARARRGLRAGRGAAPGGGRVRRRERALRRALRRRGRRARAAAAAGGGHRRGRRLRAPSSRPRRA